MKKKLFITVCMVLVSVSIFASVNGRTSVGVNYSYNDNNYFGLTTDTVGFINNSPVGYYIGTDASFNVNNINAWKVNLQLGPVYRYQIKNTAMSIDMGAGLSAAYVESDLLKMGLGGYIGAEYQFTELISLMIGAKLGSNFVSVPLEKDTKVSLDGDFYVTPYISVGFCY